MTLCLAWKSNGNVNFASDSRVSIDQEQFIDIGIKVLAVPVKIKTTTVEGLTSDIVYESKLGFCFSGDTMNAYLLKNTLEELLKNLQVASEDFSLNSLCNVIKIFTKKVSNDLREKLNWDAHIEFLIGGYCPNENEISVFHFDLVDYDTHYEVICDQILFDSGEYFIFGSGKDKAQEIIDSKGLVPGKDFMKMIREVGNDSSIPSVGGGIQYGHFESEGFKVFGVADYSIDSKGKIDCVFPFRGTLLYSNEIEAHLNNFHLAPTFITPFNEDIKKIIKGSS